MKLEDLPELLPCKYCDEEVIPTLKQNGPHMTASCPHCQKYLMHISGSEPQFYFGKYKGTLVRNFKGDEMMGYLEWWKKDEKRWKTLNKKLREAIEEKLNEKNEKTKIQKR